MNTLVHSEGKEPPPRRVTDYYDRHGARVVAYGPLTQLVTVEDRAGTQQTLSIPAGLREKT